MSFWPAFWTGLLGLSVLLFFAVEIVVLIGGARDIGSMLNALGRRGKQGGDAPPTEGDPSSPICPD